MNANNTELQVAVQAINSSIQDSRKDLGDLVRKLVDADKLHPLGVAAAMSMCATTLIASSGAVGVMPRKAVEGVIDSMFADAKELGLTTFDSLIQAMAKGGLSADQLVQKINEEAAA